MRDIRRTAAPHNSPFPLPSRQRSYVLYSTFHRDFNLCPRHFLFSPIVLRRPFWSLPDSQFASLLWETPWRDDLEKAASERRSCPPPPADTALGLTGSARCARPAEPRSPKTQHTLPTFYYYVGYVEPLCPQYKYFSWRDCFNNIPIHNYVAYLFRYIGWRICSSPFTF